MFSILNRPFKLGAKRYAHLKSPPHCSNIHELSMQHPLRIWQQLSATWSCSAAVGNPLRWLLASQQRTRSQAAWLYERDSSASAWPSLGFLLSAARGLF
ncbi:hypothetical protein FNV43_RR27253 [Rhamnella rubrinervis]|uniref:Uncharacterized protein n=1 Tax=Rhamnella rubrinervis TaxID=2594499 RepID=A0A8K0DQV9_9ROSA|nr:hypothetical protein FNV43_RR27253 [Rhamnella rubrinervis]